MKINEIEIPDPTYGVSASIGLGNLTTGGYKSFHEVLSKISSKEFPGSIKSVDIHTWIPVRKIVVAGFKDGKTEEQTKIRHTFKDRDELRNAIAFVASEFDVVSSVRVTTEELSQATVIKMLSQSKTTEWV